MRRLMARLLLQWTSGPWAASWLNCSRERLSSLEMTVSLVQVGEEGWASYCRVRVEGGGLWPFLDSLASSAPHHATLGSLSPVAGQQGLGSDPRSGVWDPKRVHAWPLDLS